MDWRDMGKVLIKNVVKGQKGYYTDEDFDKMSGEELNALSEETYTQYILTKARKIEYKRRMEGRRKKAFGAVIFKEGGTTDEGGCHGYNTFINVKEGKINKKVLSEIPDRSTCSNFKIVKVTPKTKEAFVEIRSNYAGDSTGIRGIQSIYLIKNKKKIAKLKL